VIADYTAAIQINPNDGTTFYSRGYSYLQKGDQASADADFAQAKKLGYKTNSRIANMLRSLMWWRNR
jgi:Flp pilus assembly protein TadD